MNEHTRELFILHNCDSLNATQIRRITEYAQQINIPVHAFQKKQYEEIGFSQKQINAISEHRARFSVERAFEDLKKHHVSVISVADPQYPALLKEIHDPPHFLFVQGKLPEQIPLFAVVGTRRPTPYGVSCTKSMVETLVASGFGIVSGLAYGIDSVAHRTALESGGITVAVIAHGHANYTPREYSLARTIVEKNGAILTEHLPHVHASKYHFPIRNRIIAGLAQTTLITEATRKSGTLITASCAIRENRDVFAIPGAINNPYAEGPNTLIAEGATCIHSTESLRQALGIDTRTQSAQIALPTLSVDAQAVLTALQGQPQHIDDLLNTTNCTIPTLTQSLHALTQLKIIEERPGNIFALKAR